MTQTDTQKTIMIVEDDPFIAMDLEDTFSARGYTVSGPFADVDAALKSLNQSRPNAALLDYNLGQETSIPLARKLHTEYIPYIFLSGQIESVITGHDLPERPVVSKPFVPEQLVSMVDNLI